MNSLTTVNVLRAGVTTPVTAEILGCELLDPAVVDQRFSCAKLCLPPRTGFDMHIHPSDHLLYIIEGSGHVTYVDGAASRDLHFEKGDVFPVPMGLHHAVWAGADGVVILAFGTPATLLKDPRRMQYV
jgi:mannose-6-phosphate isomerase-like protein (cupin superfamily)